MPLLETKGAASAQGFGLSLGGAEKVYIEDVFSTYLYTGNGSTQTITNNIDLSGKGGLTWLKRFQTSSFQDHALYDTNRGATKDIASNLTTGETTQSTGLTAFSSTGFSIGALAKINTNAIQYVSWTFRKQPKFFDVVTYTGNGTNRTISHNLNSVPGFIVVKRTDTTGNWPAYHRSLSVSNYINLNGSGGVGTSSTYWNNTSPTSTVFSVGTATDVNASGGTYVAYLFAHNAGGFGATGLDNVISCGSYTGNGTDPDGPTITLGYEPQWLLIVSSTLGGNGWNLYDNMRTLNWTQGAFLLANSSSWETRGAYTVRPLANGFQPATTWAGVNDAGQTYIYIAIRRGPMKTPSAATSVFSPQTYTGTGARQTITTSFTPDAWLNSWRSGSPGSTYRPLAPRLTGIYYLAVNSDQSEAEFSYQWYDGQFVVSSSGGGTTTNTVPFIAYIFKRAPSFFDVVCYKGSSSIINRPHNLAAVPELMIVRWRNRAYAIDWWVYSASLQATEYLLLNTTAAKASSTNVWNSTRPTSSVFTLGNNGNVNDNSGLYIAYLFATLPGVSKVGSYTGTGALQTVDCGFTGGARFVMIKRTDSTGDWWFYDSARGISSGTDPYILMNTFAAETTGTNYVDTTSVGFQVTAAAPAGLNASGGTYIFLAIA